MGASRSPRRQEGYGVGGHRLRFVHTATRPLRHAATGGRAQGGHRPQAGWVLRAQAPPSATASLGHRPRCPPESVSDCRAGQATAPGATRPPACAPPSRLLSAAQRTRTPLEGRRRAGTHAHSPWTPRSRGTVPPSATGAPARRCEAGERSQLHVKRPSTQHKTRTGLQ